MQAAWAQTFCFDTEMTEEERMALAAEYYGVLVGNPRIVRAARTGLEHLNEMKEQDR